MAIDVKVVINPAKQSVSSGFGYPLIFEGKATAAIAYTECSDIDDVIKVVGGILPSDNAETVATKTATAKTTNLYKAANLMLSQRNAPAKVAICATTTATTAGLASILYHGWRQLVVVSNDTEGEDTRVEIADYIETTDKMYFTSVAAVSDLSGASAIVDDKRTVVLVHDDDNAAIVFPEAALVGATAGKPAGSITYKNQILAGLTPKIMAESALNAIHAAHAMAFVLKSGDGVTSEGKTTSDEYIDIIDSTDYIVQNITYQTQKTLNSYDKVPYDDTGIAILESVCVNVLQDAANNGIIMVDNGTPEYSVDYKMRSETASADRAARRYIEGSFRFAVAGAIHTVEINGTIEI